MNKFILLFAIVFLFSNTTACQISIVCTNKRFISVDENDYQNYMNRVDWKLLKSNNVTLVISGEEYELSTEFIEKMQQFH